MDHVDGAVYEHREAEHEVVLPISCRIWNAEAVGLEEAGAAGLLATVANILAMFRLVKDMRPKDKVLIIAFAVCAAFSFGDHLAFTISFQPKLVSSIMIGKLTGGLCGFALAYWLSVPKALELERLDSDQPAKQEPE